MTVLEISLWRCCNCILTAPSPTSLETLRSKYWLKRCSKNRTELDTTDRTIAGRILRTILTRLQMAASHAVRLRADRQATPQIILTMMSLRSLNRTVQKIPEVRLLDCLRVTLFVDGTSCNMVNMYRRFRGTCRFYCQGRMINWVVHIYDNTRRHNPENSSKRNIVRTTNFTE